MNWNGKPVKTTGFAVTLVMPLKMNGRIPPEMTSRSNLGTATYISWNMPPEMGDKCQYHLIWVAALPTVWYGWQLMHDGNDGRLTAWGKEVGSGSIGSI